MVALWGMFPEIILLIDEIRLNYEVQKFKNVLDTTKSLGKYYWDAGPERVMCEKITGMSRPWKASRVHAELLYRWLPRLLPISARHGLKTAWRHT